MMSQPVDPEMMSLAAKRRRGGTHAHARHARDHADHTAYVDIVTETHDFLEVRINACEEAGIAGEHLDSIRDRVRQGLGRQPVSLHQAYR